MQAWLADNTSALTHILFGLFSILYLGGYIGHVRSRYCKCISTTTKSKHSVPVRCIILQISSNRAATNALFGLDTYTLGLSSSYNNTKLDC